MRRIAVVGLLLVLLSAVAFPIVVSAAPLPPKDITLDDSNTSLHYWTWPGSSTPGAHAWNYDTWNLTVATTGDAQVRIEWFDTYPTNDVYDLYVDGVKVATNVAGATGTWTGWLTKGLHVVVVDWIYYQTNKTPISGGSYYDITFTVLQQKLPVCIDVKPGSDVNPINLGEKGLLPVAILGSADFDVACIDASSIQIGGVTLAERGSPKAPKLAFSYEDVNLDGYTDMMVFFSVPSLVEGGQLTEVTAQLVVTGNLLSGVLFEGTDYVAIVPA